MAPNSQQACAEHTTHQVYIGLGANLNKPQQQLEQALQAIDNIAQCRLCRVSSFYRSRPMGPADQPDYINAVALVETQLTPYELLDCLQAVEQQQGRVRKAERWGPRTLDLDIILFDQLQIDSERLTIPHYGAKLRNFVLLPLAEIAPDLCFPDGDSIADLLRRVSAEGIEKITND